MQPMRITLISMKTDIRAFRAALRRLEREIDLELKSQTSCCGVTLAQCHLLLELEILGTSSVGSLADAMGLDKSTLSRTVESLRKLGWVDCPRAEGDRRLLQVSLLPAGRALLEGINASCDKRYTALLASLGDAERRKLMEGTETLARIMFAARKEKSKEADYGCCGA